MKWKWCQVELMKMRLKLLELIIRDPGTTVYYSFESNYTFINSWEAAGLPEGGAGIIIEGPPEVYQATTTETSTDNVAEDSNAEREACLESASDDFDRNMGFNEDGSISIADGTNVAGILYAGVRAIYDVSQCP